MKVVVDSEIMKELERRIDEIQKTAVQFAAVLCALTNKYGEHYELEGGEKRVGYFLEQTELNEISGSEVFVNEGSSDGVDGFLVTINLGDGTVINLPEANGADGG